MDQDDNGGFSLGDMTALVHESQGLVGAIKGQPEPGAYPNASRHQAASAPNSAGGLLGLGGGGGVLLPLAVGILIAWLVTKAKGAIWGILAGVVAFFLLRMFFGGSAVASDKVAAA